MGSKRGTQKAKATGKRGTKGLPPKEVSAHQAKSVRGGGSNAGTVAAGWNLKPNKTV